MSETEKPGEPQARPPQQQSSSKKPKKAWYRRPVIAGIVMLVLITAVVVGVLWWRHSREYVTTDDAYIDIQSQFVSPQVPGRVARVLVNDNQDVNVGDVLLEIDPSDYEARLEQAKAAEAQSEAQVEQAKAQALVMDAQFRQAQANVLVAQANATNAARDLQRYTSLRDSLPGAVSQQQLDTASTQARTTSDQALVAQKAADAAQAQLGYVSRQISAAQAGQHSAQAQVALAELNLSYTKVKAEVAGRISGKLIAPGNYLQPGAQVMAVVPTNVYVTANFKETQLAHMRPNQAVEIKIDAYPDMKLRGHVDSVQPSSGQAFSILPPQNATGNWVKIVQRVPVKILFDTPPGDAVRRVGPGMSVEVKVTISTAGS
ncbi:MAG TPA: HlyD family secretion protein [Verrucomicrobiae bacterium]|jgi:membrane fusion protein (multidrug efflux system)|nr:HlyD family secretion protein [Verrucomicrobiae bacterium]